MLKFSGLSCLTSGENFRVRKVYGAKALPKAELLALKTQRKGNPFIVALTSPTNENHSKRVTTSSVVFRRKVPLWIWKKSAASVACLTREAEDFNRTELCEVNWLTEANMLEGYPSSAGCVQRPDDSRNSAIRIEYRLLLRSSSVWEPRYPSLKIY